MSYPDEAVLRHMEDGLGEVTGEGEAAGGLIRAVTDPAGGLLKLTFNPRVMRMDSHELADEAAEAVRRAQADGQRKTRELVGGALGPLAPEGLPDQARFWDGLREIQEAFDRSMTEREDEVARRLRDLD
ncbi:YbaB/EbfC family nucleoid-associated protein [Streptosporangium sp. CA-135522]|uniref:YbaB/EbfC family nucleoid-associated protein n=1 Tax=Streptosporangium sp. CA-135522 TaxID=3240072 RepID=UPI003D8C12A3